MDKISVKRFKIKTFFGNSYFIVGENDCMIVVADENNRQHAELRAMTEAICRISSKAMKARLPMAEIAEQLRKADSGRCTILSDLAAKMEEYGAANGNNS